MKKYIFPKYVSAGMILDTETMDITTLDSPSSYIDWTYIAPEDGVVTVNGVEKEIKKGDYILKMYTPSKDGEQPTFILKDPELIEYIREYNNICDKESNSSQLSKSLCLSEDVCEPSIQG